LISGKISSVLRCEKGPTLLRVLEAAFSASRIFCATKPNAGGFIEEKSGLERLMGRLPYGAGI
jgi:hypothetical protein